MDTALLVGFLIIAILVLMAFNSGRDNENKRLRRQLRQTQWDNYNLRRRFYDPDSSAYDYADEYDYWDTDNRRLDSTFYMPQQYWNPYGRSLLSRIVWALALLAVYGGFALYLVSQH